MTAGKTTEDLPTRFQIDCLTAIGQLDAPSGSDVKSLLTAVYGTDVNHGRLYPNLDTLVEAGLVEKGQHDRRTNKYALTDQGRELLRRRIEWLSEGIPVGAESGELVADGGTPGSHLAAADDQLVEAATASRDGDCEQAREAIRRARQRIQAAMTSDGGEA